MTVTSWGASHGLAKYSLAKYHARGIAIAVSAALAVPMLIGYAPKQASGTTSPFRFFSSICVTVYESNETFKPILRDDLAVAIAPLLSARANELRDGLRVAPRPQCIRRDAPMFEKQMMADLYVSRQQVLLEDSNLSVAVIAGSVPNVLGPLAPHQLAPIVILDRSHIDGRRIEDALIRFFDGTVLALLRAHTAK